MKRTSATRNEQILSDGDPAPREARERFVVGDRSGESPAAKGTLEDRDFVWMGYLLESTSGEVMPVC